MTFGLEPDIPRGGVFTKSVLGFLSRHYRKPISEILNRKPTMRWLILDCDYLCHRAHYVMRDLSHKDSPTGVVFGFFQQLINVRNLFDPSRLIFCFDSRISLRKGSYPAYKSNREEKDPSLVSQIKRLRREYLPQIGCQNVLHQKGYEADDIIAWICISQGPLLQSGDELIIVSADHDLYQLLTPNVHIWHPQHELLITPESFTKEYGVTPIQWIDVRAIAGCSTDCIAGVEGVGEKTAAKFLNGTINTKSKKFEAIVKGNKIWKRNLRLVQLPHSGINSFDLEDDSISKKKWNQLCNQLGMKSILDDLGD